MLPVSSPKEREEEVISVLAPNHTTRTLDLGSVRNVVGASGAGGMDV